MDTFRKWLNKPKADDKSLLARFYHADRLLTAVASELDSFDGRAEPDRCSRLVSRLRQGQDKVLAITNLIMEELLGEDRDARSFRAKFPEEVLQENLAGQLWFGAECLAAGSSIMNREQESKEMRPLAQAVTKSLGNVRNQLRDQCLRNNVPNSKTLHLDVNDITTEQLYESLKIFDRLFSEFEMRYVSAMVQVKTKHEYEMQELICVLFSETLQRALQLNLLEQEKVDAFDPALMFSIPRLAIIAGLVIYAKGPLNMDMPADQLSEMFRPFRTILIKIRDLLRTLSHAELLQLERLLCTNEDIQLKIPVGTSSIEAPSTDQQNNNTNNNNNSSPKIPKTSSCTTSQRNSATRNSNQYTANVLEPHHNKDVSKCSTTKTDNATPRYAMVRTPSTSSLSADSSAPSTPSASLSSTPSIAGTSWIGSTSTNSPVDWSEEEEDEEDANEENDITAPTSTESLDIGAADCTSGYLIPNTNFGNLLQPQNVPLTDNFIASEDELNQRNSDDAEDLPTTSAASNEQQRQCTISLSSSSSGISDELTIQAKLQDVNCAEIATMYISSTDSSSASGHGFTTSSRSNSSSSSCIQKTTTSCSSSSLLSPAASIREQSSNDDGSSYTRSNLTQPRPSGGHRHSQYNHSHQHHQHHHHHHHHRSRNHNSKVKSSCQDNSSLSIKDEATDNVLSSKSSSSALQHDTSSVDSSTSSSLSDGDQHEIASARRTAGRNKYKSTENLLHRLFVCIAGVADQLQTNFASDLRQILRSVFLMNMSATQEEIDIPEKPKESELFEFRASENDVMIQENGGSNTSIYSAEEVNPEQDNVFQNSRSANNSSGNSSSSSNSSNRMNVRHSAGATILPRGNTIDLGTGVDNSSTVSGRNVIGRSRSLGDQENNEITTSNNRRLSSYINGRRLSSSPHQQQNGNVQTQQQHLHQRNRNNSVGSNSPSSSASSSSESNSPVSERVSSTSIFSNSNNINNNNNATNINNETINPPPQQLHATTELNARLSPPAWVPDDKAPRCMSCRTAFTAFRRRHHCRNCGGVFCGVCSNASAPLPKYGLTKAVRVCRDCYQREVRANTAAATHTHAAAMTTTAGGS